MPVTKKDTIKQKVYNDVIVNEEARDYNNDPFVLKKVTDAKEFLRLHPIPDWILKKHDKK